MINSRHDLRLQMHLLLIDHLPFLQHLMIRKNLDTGLESVIPAFFQITHMYGNRPPVEIKRDLEAQESPRLTNEEDDLGIMYSANFWRKIIASTTLAINIPQQYRDILKLPHTEQKLWKTAMEDEIKSLDERKVWDLVALPPGRIPVKGRWVYAVKSNGRKKARFVAKGFMYTDIRDRL